MGIKPQVVEAPRSRQGSYRPLPAFGIVKQSIRQQAMAECMKIAKGQKTIAGAMIAQNCGIAVWKILSCSACMMEKEMLETPPDPENSENFHRCLSGNI